DRAVIVPPSWPGDRNDYALEAVKRYPERFRVMGRIPLQDPKSAGLPPKWEHQPGVVGGGVIFHNPRTIPSLHDGTPGRFVGAGGPVMCSAPGRIAAFGQIAQKHPQLTLIIDHMGVNMAMADDGRLEGAIGETVALAKYPNVSVKLSASPGISREPYPFRDVT